MQVKMSLSEWEYLLFASETSLEYSEFHATNPFANNIEELHTLSTQAEIAPLDITADLFLDDVMSDNVSNIEQNSQIARTSQANSSKMSFDSTELANATPMNHTNVWPPLNTSVIVTGDWPNSNREVATSSDISKWVENMNVGMTLGEITPHLGTNADPLGSGVPVFDSSRNTLGDTAIAPSESQPGKRKTRKGITLQNYASTTPPLLGPSTLRLERTATLQHSDAGSAASPNSTIARGIKETEAIREDFGRSMEQLKRVQVKLAQENTDHVRRAEVLVMEVEELRKEVSEIKMEGRFNQGKIETSVASVKDLTEKRISEMTAIMVQRDRQADERLKHMSEMMHHRDLDVDKRMVDLMTTVQDLTLGVKTVVATIPNRPSLVPMAPNSADIPSTSASSSQHPSYREVAKRQCVTKPDQTKQPKLQPPAAYKQVPMKTQQSTTTQTEVQRCDISGPPSFDPYARGASTTRDYYSAASDQMHSNMKTASGSTEYQTAVSSMLGTKRSMLPHSNDQLRPLASSTQRKTISRRNLNTGTVEGAAKDKDNAPNAIHSQALAEAITTAMSKGLEPLLAAKESKNKPTKYRGTRDGIVDGWLMLMRRYLEKAHAKDTPLDKAWTIVEFLENEARDYITNKSEAERDTDGKVFALLARRFGTGSNKIQIQQQFRTRNQSPDEDYMQYLDALEGLRSQGFPNEEVAVRRYEIMQKFIEGVRSYELKRNLALMYAQEQYVDTPPTVEALRFTVQQYLRMRGSTRSENYPAPQQQQQPPVATNPQNQAQAQAPQAPNAQQLPQQPPTFRQQPQRTCFNCGDPSHFPADCPLKDRARKPVQQIVNSCRKNTAGEWMCPSNPRGMNDDLMPATLPEQGTSAFCVNCSHVGHVASDCMTPHNVATEEQVKAAWYAPVANSTDFCDSEDQIRVISTSEDGGPSRPVVVTCGEKQILTTLEAPAPDCTETLISIHLLLSAEQKARPNLTLAQLKEELCRNTSLTIASRPLPHFTRNDETKLAQIQRVKTIAPVPVAITVDGVDMRFDAIVVLEGHFPQGLYLGRQELRCYSIGVQDAQGEAQIDERASLVVAFGTPLQKPIPLFGMIDTGSGVSILSLSAYKKIASQHMLSLSPYDVELFAANGKNITTVGIAEDVNFQLGGYTLKTNFVVIADHIGSEDFLLGRNFLRTYNVLVDLTAMKVTIRDPKTPRIFKATHEVSDHEPSFVVSTEDIILGPFERKIVRAKIITQQPDTFLFRNVTVHSCSIKSTSVFVSEDTLTSVGEGGIVFLAIRNQTDKERVKIKAQTVIGKAALTTFVLNSVLMQTEGEASKLSAEYVNQIHRNFDMDTSSEFSSFAQNFLSSTEPSEAGLSDNEKRKRTDPQLLKAIPGPDFSSVLSSWGKRRETS